LFDGDAFRQAWLADLRREKGLEASAQGDYTFERFQEEQFDRLAEVVRGCLDVGSLLEITRGSP
jgi:adenosylcobyric acid synthase